MAREKTTFGGDFKRFFIRGLAILLPSVLTLWILWQAYMFVDRQVAEPINRGLRQAILWVIPQVFRDENLPSWFAVTDEEVKQYRTTLEREVSPEALARQRWSDPELRAQLRATRFKQFWDAHWYFRFIGLLVAVTLIYLAGRLLGGFLGRRAYAAFERFFTRIPLLRSVYPHVKQVVEMIFGEKQIAFKQVVMVEYPRKGIWSVGFVTGAGMLGVRDLAGEEVVTVFVPSTPTPFTGFTITVKRSEAMDVALSVDEALRFLLTGGVLVPAHQALPGGPSNMIEERAREVGARTERVVEGRKA